MIGHWRGKGNLFRKLYDEKRIEHSMRVIKGPIGSSHFRGGGEKWGTKGGPSKNGQGKPYSGRLVKGDYKSLLMRGWITKKGVEKGKRINGVEG